MVALIVVIAVVVLVALALVVSYNRFVAQRQQVQNAWSNVDTELKRRYDLVPNLVSTVQGYAAHERGVFDEVTRARAAAQAAQGPAASSAAEGPFSAALGRLMAVAEAYPQLKANENFLQLQGALADTEDRIQQSRSSYNSVVQQFNRRIQAFPSNVIAGMFHFQAAEFFHIDEAKRAVESEPPRVDFTGVPQAPPAAPAGTTGQQAPSGAAPTSTPPAAG